MKISPIDFFTKVECFILIPFPFWAYLLDVKNMVFFIVAFKNTFNQKFFPFESS